MQLTLEQVKKHPALMLYCWADKDAFLSKLDRKTAGIIAQKKANQLQVMALLSGGYNNQFYANLAEVKQAFVDIYDMTPEKALVTLANGGEVAGKNWVQGIYGVGKTQRIDFVQNSAVKVDTETGKILVNGVAVEASPVYGGVGYKNIKGYSYVLGGVTFSSQLIGKKYFAGTVTLADGTTQDANGDPVTDADSSSIWLSIIGFVEKLVNWFLTVIGKEDKKITAENTIPAQGDGFTYDTAEAGFPWWILALVGGGWLLSGGKFKTKK